MQKPSLFRSMLHISGKRTLVRRTWGLLGADTHLHDANWILDRTLMQSKLLQLPPKKIIYLETQVWYIRALPNIASSHNHTLLY